MSEKVRFWNLPFLILLTGALITVFNIGVTNVAIPTIASSLNANGLQIHFIANAVTLTLASFVLLMGAIGDKYGRKLLFLTGCVVMIVASTFSGVSTSANTLIAWRLFAGFAVAMLYPTTLSMLTIIFKDPKQRFLAIGIWSGVSAAGAAIAPVISGILLEYFSWGSVYHISTPFTLFALLLGLKYLPEFKNEKATAIDYIGGILTVLFVSCILFAIILVPTEGFSLRVFVALIISFVSLVGFIVQEFTTKYPLLDLRVFKNNRFSVGASIITLVAFAQLGVMFLAQQFVQNVLGYDTLNAGLSGLPLSVSVLFISPMSARIADKIGNKFTIASGLVCIAFGFFTALFWTVNSAYAQIFTSYLFIGIGLGLAAVPSTNAIMNSLPSEKAGVASAVNDVTRDFGSSLGIAVNGSIAAMSYTGVLDKMYHNAPTADQIPVAQNIASTITSSLTGALNIAKQYPGVDGNQLAAAARQAFLDGQISAMTLSVVLCLVGTTIVLLFMPSKSSK